VASGSSERPKPPTSVSPSQIAPTSTARCEMDLSPGNARAPRTDTAGATKVMNCAPGASLAKEASERRAGQYNQVRTSDASAPSCRQRRQAAAKPGFARLEPVPAQGRKSPDPFAHQA